MQVIAKSLLFPKNLKLLAFQNLTGPVGVLSFHCSSNVEHVLQGKLPTCPVGFEVMAMTSESTVCSVADRNTSCRRYVQLVFRPSVLLK